MKGFFKEMQGMRKLVAIVVAFVVSAPALAQSWPAKPVRIIVPNTAGGPTDVLARLMSQRLQEAWNQSVIVDYKPGAGTVTGTDYVAKSAPDGYTVGLSVSSLMVNPSLRTNLPYDTLRDLSGVTLTAVAHNALVATPGLPANTLAELIALAKKEPGKLTYASAGVGSGLHMTAELLKMTAGIDMVHIAYKGSAPAYPDVVAGRVHLMVEPLYSALPYIRSGKMKAIAVASPQRASITPDVPAIAETFPGFRVQSLNGIIVPSATPRDIVSRLNAGFISTLKAPELRKRMAEMGLEPAGSTPEEFDALIRSEIEKWAKVVKFAGIKPE
jgi:tripartite-type tricarboxylate transporter receptor subunit TctC